MDQTMLLYVAIAVFSLMIIGLVLTIWEFSRGEPHQQVKAHQDESAEMPTGKPVQLS